MTLGSTRCWNRNAHKIYTLIFLFANRRSLDCAHCVGCSSAEIFFLSPQGFQLPFFSFTGTFCCNLSLSSRVSAAILSSRSRVLFCRLQPGLSLRGSLSSQSVPSCCSRIVYMLYQNNLHKIEWYVLADEVVIYRLSDGLLLCQSLGTTGDIHCNLLSLSPRGFQLPTFCAGWCSSAVIFLSPWGFQLPTFRAGWFSTANLSCWLVLIRCNLSLSSGVSATILPVHGYFSAVIFLLKGFGCHSFAFTGTFLPAAA